MAQNNVLLQRGFTFVEWLVAITIVLAVTSLSIPSYLHHIHKNDYSEFVDAIGPYKAGVELCYQTTSDLTQCNGGQNSVPNNVLTSSRNDDIEWLITNAGVIYLFPKNKNEFTLLGDYMILNPTAKDAKTLSWRFAGPAVTKGYVSN